MGKRLCALVLATALAVPALAGAETVTAGDFEAKTTRDLINLCTASPDDPRSAEAIHFCHGYLVGAYAYHVAENSGPRAKPMVCLPKQAPSRNEAIAMFVEWAKAHPEFMDERPVETEFRFLMEKWPCSR